MDNAYVHGLKQYDSRPKSPVIVPHNLSELRKKILFENTLLEERALHEFSAGKGDGAGVDTGSAPLKPLTSPTPSPTTTPTPTVTPTRTLTPTPTVTPSAAAPSGFPNVASTNQIAITGITGIMYGVANNGMGTYTKNGPINSNTNVGAIYYAINVGVDPSAAITFLNGRWELNFNDDGSQTYSINTSSDSTTIPTTGWSPSITITAPTFPNVATTSTVNALINTSDATTSSYLQSVGFAAGGGVFFVPLTKQVPPSQPYYSSEYKTTFNDGAKCYLVHSTAASNRWFFVMEKFSYYDEEFGNQYSTLIIISTATGQSSDTIPAARSTYSGTNINSMVSPNCLS